MTSFFIAAGKAEKPGPGWGTFRRKGDIPDA